jgi:hypothetical protein
MFHGGVRISMGRDPTLTARASPANAKATIPARIFNTGSTGNFLSGGTLSSSRRENVVFLAMISSYFYLNVKKYFMSD